MLIKVNKNDMYNFLKEIHPTANSDALTEKASQYVQNLDAVFDDIILNYCKDGTLTEFNHGEFCLSLIMSLRKCSFPQAVLLMDSYIKDPVVGKANILHR